MDDRVYVIMYTDGMSDEVIPPIYANREDAERRLGELESSGGGLVANWYFIDEMDFVR